MIFPFISYAVQYCSHHLRCCEDSQHSDRSKCLSLALLSVDTSRSKNLTCLYRTLYVSFRNQIRFDSLYWGYYAGLYKPSRLFLVHGADIDINAEGSCSPLHGAIMGANTRTIRLLIENGADVNAFKIYAWTDGQMASWVISMLFSLERIAATQMHYGYFLP